MAKDTKNGKYSPLLSPFTFPLFPPHFYSLFCCMSLTLAANPPLVHFCKNGLLFKANTDNLFSQIGHKAFFSLYKTGNLIAGDTIIFEWATHSVTLTAVSHPDDSGYQIKELTTYSVAFFNQKKGKRFSPSLRAFICSFLHFSSIKKTVEVLIFNGLPYFACYICGESGIRTRGTVSSTTV
jgi:hypothetical protein